MHHGTTVDNLLVGIHRRIDHHAIGVLAKEIAQIHGLLQPRLYGRLRHVVHHLRGCDHAYITNRIHVANGILGLTHEVDEVGCSLGVLGVLGDHPAIKPHHATLIGYDVVQLHTNRLGLVDSPHRIATPREVEPRLLLGHDLLAEIGLPAGYIGLRLLQQTLHQGDRLVRRVVHQRVELHLATLQLLLLGVDQQRAIDVAEGIFDE